MFSFVCVCVFPLLFFFFYSISFNATYVNLYHAADCGYWVENQDAGTITFNPNAIGQDYYDCIWIIKKHPSFERVMVKVTKYMTSGQYGTEMMGVVVVYW